MAQRDKYAAIKALEKMRGKPFSQEELDEQFNKEVDLPLEAGEDTLADAARKRAAQGIMGAFGQAPAPESVKFKPQERVTPEMLNVPQEISVEPKRTADDLAAEHQAAVRAYYANPSPETEAAFKRAQQAMRELALKRRMQGP